MELLYLKHTAPSHSTLSSLDKHLIVCYFAHILCVHHNKPEGEMIDVQINIHFDHVR